MAQCPSISNVHLLHDGELAADAEAFMQAHLQNCAECAAELAELGAISPALGGLFSEIVLTPMERARLDARIKSQSNLQGASSDRSDLDWAELARTARMLSAMAASIVIISSIWLAEIPSRHTTAVSPAVVVLSARDRDQALANSADTPAWERAALTLRVDPRPEDSRGGPSDVGVADARLFNDNSADGSVADWIVAGLENPSAGPAHAYP